MEVRMDKLEGIRQGDLQNVVLVASLVMEGDNY
jgi:hypothetical protein